MIAARLWGRSVARRPLALLLLVALSAAAVLTAVLAPLLVRAVEQSTLAASLAAAGPDGTSITVYADVPDGEPYDQGRQPTLSAIDAGRRDADAALWGEPQTLITSTTIVAWTAPGDPITINARVNAVDACDAYAITEGSCPTTAVGADGSSEAMLSTADAVRHEVAIGQTISFAMARAPRTDVRIVGLYDAEGSPTAGLIRAGSTSGALAGVASDPIVLATGTAAELPMDVQVSAVLRIRPDLGTDDVAAVERAHELIVGAVTSQDRRLDLRTDIPDLLEQITGQAASARILILVTTAQAVLLDLFALVVVLQRLARARAAEWSVGRLRGVPRPRWLASIYLEPAVALLLGLPIGLAGGIGLAGLLVGISLRPGTPLDLTGWAVPAAATGTVVVALTALILVSLGSVRRPLAELVQQEAENRRLGVIGAVVHAGVFVLAAATLYQLATGGQLSTGGPQLGLIAPALVALAAAMAAVRLCVVAVRPSAPGSGRRPRLPRTLTALVVGRHVARVPSSLNPAMIIAVGIALAVFAGQVAHLSERNQGLRADAITGATTVLTVSAPRGTDLVDAVRSADPSGTQAMAAMETALGQSGGLARVVAVDASRLSTVASWDPAWTGVADLGARLTAGAAESIVLQGSTAEVALTGVDAQPLPLPNPNAVGVVDPPPPPEVVLTVETRGTWRQVRFGRLTAAASETAAPVDQTLRAELPCETGCRVVGLGLLGAANQPYEVTMTVASISTDRQPAEQSLGWLRDAARWRQPSSQLVQPRPAASATVTADGTGLRLEGRDAEGVGLTQVWAADAVDPLPAVLSPGSRFEPVSGRPGAVVGVGLDGQQQQLDVVARAAVLPRSLDEGVLVDLTTARRLIDPSTVDAVTEVWLAPGAGAEVEAALAEQGITVQARDRLAETRTALLEQAVTRGAAVAVDLGLVALALAFVALIAARWADADRRGGDWAALREAGLDRRRIAALVRAEVALPGLAAVVLGAICGLVSVRVAAPRLPLVDAATPGPPLDLSLAWGPVGVLVGCAALGVVLIAQVSGLLEARRSQPGGTR